MHKPLTIVPLLASLFACSPLLSQVAFPPSQRTPVTGSSQAKRAVVDEKEAANATPSSVSGTFVANFTVKLSSTVPSGSSVLCYLNASVTDENTSTYAINNEIYESASTKATISGTTATCSVKLPYQWYLSNLSTDTADLTYYLYILNTSSTNESGQTRSSSQYVPGAGAIKIPANGATTTYSIAATL